MEARGYTRREPRFAIELSAKLTVSPGPTLRASTVDVSRHGAGVQLDMFVAPGCPVVVHFTDPLPVEMELPPLCGTVTSARSLAANGGVGFRVGIRIASPVPASLSTLCKKLSRSPRENEARDADTPAGRERLFQTAHELAVERRHQDAREVLWLALGREPDNAHYLAMWHRLSAEIEDRGGNSAAAYREAMRALSLLPDDVELRALVRRLQGLRQH